jgi:transporter family-2 protein
MLNKWFYVIMAILGGVSISPQGAINAILGRYIGNLQAAVVSFAVGLGTLLLVMVALAFRYPGQWSRIGQAPLMTFTGGLLGAVIVFTVLITVPRIGATPTVMGILIGQVISSIAIDHYGWFDLPVMPLEPTRIIGLILLVVALPLVLR